MENDLENDFENHLENDLENDFENHLENDLENDLEPATTPRNAMDFPEPRHIDCPEVVDSPTLYYLESILDGQDWGDLDLNTEPLGENGLGDLGENGLGHLGQNGLGPLGENERLRRRNAELFIEMANLRSVNRGLENHIRNLQIEIRNLQARTRSISSVVKFTIGGHSFTGVMSPEIHFARAGSQFAVYPPGSAPPAIAEVILPRSRPEMDGTRPRGGGGGGDEPVPFIGCIHSILEVKV